MKSVFSPLFTAMLIFSAFSVGLLQGCKISKPASGDHLRIRIPLDDGSNHYTLREVTLDSVTNLSVMAGPVVRFKSHGGLFTKSQGASSMNEGNDPTARFIQDADGVYVATDPASLTMATAYYHFEKIKTFFDQWGENRELKFPRLVMLEPDYLEVDSGFGNVLPPVNNAMYNPIFDVFILTKSDASVTVPVSFNGGILAHEYSHSIFNRYVVRNVSGLTLNENAVTKLNRFYLKAIDEGVADFFGALYSGNPNFNVATYGEEKAGIRNMGDFKGLNENPREVQERLAAGEALDPHYFGAKIASFLWKLKGEWNGPGTATIVWGAVDRYMKKTFSKFDQQPFDFVDFVEGVVDSKSNFEGQVSKISYSPEKDCALGKQFLGMFGNRTVICDPLSVSGASTPPVPLAGVTQ